MNRIFRFSLLAALLIPMASCSLNMEPESTMTDAAYWKTEGDLRGACNRFYEQMNGNNDLGTGFSHDYRSDELSNNGRANGTSAGSWLIPSTNGAWTDAYWRIFIANNIIEKAPKADVSEEVLNKYLAEARFFRGFFYFELVKKYGDVPLLLKAINDTKDPDIKMPRTPRAEVIAQVYEDLEFAAKWLPDIDHTDKWGRASSDAALAMIARVGLYEGTHAKFHNTGINAEANLKKSVDAAEKVISSNRFELYPDFEGLVQIEAEGRGNKENIFVKEYGPNGAATTTHSNSRQMENAVSLTRNMVDLFLYTDGLPREKSPLKVSPETSYDDVFTDRDPRLGMTIYRIGEDAYKGPFKPFGFSTGYSLKKGFSLEQWNTSNKEYIDKMIIRYAEVLLTYAEALYELNGQISDSQLDMTVNAVRRRAGMPAMLTNAFVAQNALDMREEIRRERTIEFIDENKRYDDIIRWKTAEEVLPVNIIGAKFISDESGKQREEYESHLTKAGVSNGAVRYGDEDDIYVIEYAEDRRFDPAKDYLYPVPLYEIAQSGGAVTQNPGWK